MYPEAIVQSNMTVPTRSLFSFTMGGVTIYPLFLLPLIFWISPISSTSTDLKEGEEGDLKKEHRMHEGYSLETDSPEALDDKPFFVDQPPSKRPTSQTRQLPYYPRQQHPFLNPMFGNQYQPTPSFPSSDPFAQSYPSGNPYQPSSPYPAGNQYQSAPPNQNKNPYMSISPYQPIAPVPFPLVNPMIPQLPAPGPYLSSIISQPHNIYSANSFQYDPYVLIPFTRPYPPKKNPYNPNQPSLPPRLNTIFNKLQQIFQEAQESETPFYQPKPPSKDPVPILNPFQSEPQTIGSFLPPGSASHTAFSSSSSEPTVSQSQAGGYPPPSSSVSTSIFSPINPNIYFPSMQPQLQESQKQQSMMFFPNANGYTDKQVRNQNEDPSDIVNNPPPKAIMSLEVRGHKGKRPFHFYLSPEKQRTKNSLPLWHTTIHLSNKKFSSNKPRNPKLKISNETEEICEDCDNLADKDYISEPILGESMLSSPNWEMIDAMLAENKRKRKQQAHNIAPTEADEHEPVLNMPVDPNSPIPLFVTGDDEDVYFGQQDQSEEDPALSKVKSQLYRCPPPQNHNQPEIFPDALRCDRFYYCKFGRAYVFRCPVNHSFNAFRNLCERDEDYACSMMFKKK